MCAARPHFLAFRTFIVQNSAHAFMLRRGCKTSNARTSPGARANPPWPRHHLKQFVPAVRSFVADPDQLFPLPRRPRCNIILAHHQSPDHLFSPACRHDRHDSLANFFSSSWRRHRTRASCRRMQTDSANHLERKCSERPSLWWHAPYVAQLPAGVVGPGQCFL